MGQYYQAVIYKDKPEPGSCATAIPWSFDSGAKLIESCYKGNEYVRAVMDFIAENGPVRVVTCGDYAWTDRKDATDLEKEYTAKLKRLGFESDPYEFSENGAEVLDPDRPKGKYRRYIVNEDRKEYIDLQKLPVTDILAKKGKFTWARRINPLTLLTAVGNGLGGGDFHGIGEENVGLWAGDALTMSGKRPQEKDGYTERPAEFAERWGGGPDFGILFESDREIAGKIGESLRMPPDEVKDRDGDIFISSDEYQFLTGKADYTWDMVLARMTEDAAAVWKMVREIIPDPSQEDLYRIMKADNWGAAKKGEVLRRKGGKEFLARYLSDHSVADFNKALFYWSDKTREEFLDDRFSVGWRVRGLGLPDGALSVNYDALEASLGTKALLGEHGCFEAC